MLVCVTSSSFLNTLQIVAKGNSVSCSNTPQVRPRNGKGIALHNNQRFGRNVQPKPENKDCNDILLSPTRSEEHQYDIPFSHLSPGAIRSRNTNVNDDLNPEYDEMLLNHSNGHGNRGSTAVLLPRGRTKSAKGHWNKFSSDNGKLHSENHAKVAELNSTGRLWGGNTLLQPRVISGETGGTPLLAKHVDTMEGTQRWSGSDRSIDTSIYSGIQSYSPRFIYQIIRLITPSYGTEN